MRQVDQLKMFVVLQAISKRLTTLIIDLTLNQQQLSEVATRQGKGNRDSTLVSHTIVRKIEFLQTITSLNSHHNVL